MRRTILLAFALLIGCGDNNSSSSDATPPDAAPDGSNEDVCETLQPLPSGTCEVTAGDDRKLIKGNVLTPGKVFIGGQVAVDASGQITCTGCNCAAGGETVISCPGAAVSPGLINTHDHITFTQNPPYTDAGVRYNDRQQWRKGFDGKPKISSSGGASADAIRWGELRFLMGGATSIVGSGGQAGLLRNLDSATNQEGLGQTAVKFDTFPLDDSSGTRRTADCDYGGSTTTPAEIMSNDSYEPHTSEGIDTTARNEFLCESSTTYDTTTQTSQNLLLPKTAMIHAIGLTAADYAQMAAANTALIWSPRSNITLYGDTARVSEAAKLGVEIALGTDWMPTGSMNLLRELRCADSFNKTYLDNFFNDEALWRMVTSNAASVTATDEAIGLLAPGHLADISIFAGHGKTYRAVIDAEPQDVALVMRAGKVLYGDDAAVNALGTNCDTVDVCGTGKRVCLMSEIAKTFDQLKTGAGANIYPAFSCTAPTNEPSCTPMRPTEYNGIVAGDMDGDGIADASDKCPKVFDPIRPMDNATQSDADGDGVGDACDPCPLDANTTTCSVPDPNDRDADGKVNGMDNCPDNANPGQEDADNDGKGDACDACPNDANPGAAGCPKSIYAIKNGSVPVGANVVVNNALVTGKGSNGFFVQVKAGDTGYNGSDYSGLFVFTNTGSPFLTSATVGARVTISARVANFQGEIELDTISALTVLAVGPESPPAPVTATYAEIKTGGTRAAQLEGVIVQLPASTVSATNPSFGEYTVSDGTDMLVIDDFIYQPNPAPQTGESFTQIIGVLALRQSASKLEPRDPGDLTAGAPGISTFGPALSYVRTGTTNVPTFPTPLKIQLTASVAADTPVLLASNSADLTVPASVTVPMGASSATVLVSGVNANADVTLTATLGVQVKTAHVRVLGTNELPTALTISPTAAGVAPGGTVQFTVSTDIPVPANTTVDLAVNPSTAGTVPASVAITADTQSATFTFTNALSTGSATITASTTTPVLSVNAMVTVATGPDHLVIRQLYPGGGNSGATYNRDFVELFNPSNGTISLSGKSLQYASATGTTWSVAALPATASIPPGGSYLVQLQGGTTGVALPTPDFSSSAINMGAAAGKLAFVDDTAALSGACPTDNIIDIVGWGTSTTTCSEGDVAPPPSPNTKSLSRAMNGCTDADDNSMDFAVVDVTPRNSATTPTPCL